MKLSTVVDQIACTLWRRRFNEQISSEMYDIDFCRNKLEEILTQNIIPFWYPRTIDKENGGYRLHHDIQGRWKGPTNKSSLAQARMVWFFSTLADTKFGNGNHLATARHGYDFLMNHCWDERYGGLYWEVDHAGVKATAPEKHSVCQSFGLYALAAYARISGDTTAEERAQDIFALLNSHAYDDRFGGYREFLRRDWGEAPEGQTLYMKAYPRHKTLNTHSHLLEAFTEYYKLTQDSAVREKIIELVLIQTNSVIRKNGVACTNLFDLDWRPCAGELAERVTYGHDLQNIWTLIEACQTINISVGPLTEFFKNNFEYTIRFGYDYRKGGLYVRGPVNKPANDRAKVLWPQAEGLVCSLYMYQLTGEHKYYSYFRHLLAWIANHQVDWKHGEWYQRITTLGRAVGDKAYAWKTPYHNGRAMILCLDRLSNLAA